MAYTISVSGDASSKKEEAEALIGIARLLERTGSKGAVSFVGEHFTVSASAGEDALADISKVLDEYNAAADRDDKAGV
jgi:hypothetical protein